MKVKKQAGRILSNEKGFVLPLAFIFITIIALLGATALIATTTDLRIATNYKTSVQASFIAEAGVEHGLNWLRNQSVPPTRTDAFDPLDGDVALGAGYYEISIDPDDNNPNVYLNRYRITSIGSVGDSTRTIVMEVMVESFSRYAYFTNYEYFNGTPVWFTCHCHLTGPTHTNSHFRISRNPIFAGPVSSADDFIVYMHGGPPYDNPDFQQGIQLGVAMIEMPTDTTVVRDRAGLLLDGDTTVTLLADGTMNVTNAARGWVNQNMSLPANGVLHVDDGTLSISGTLKGRLTAGSEENIIITGNIVYNTDPRDPYLDPPSQDMLGLVAEENVVVCRYAGHDVEINASIMAIDGSFTVESWWWGLRGTLTVYGGIIQDSRGPVGTFSRHTGQRRSGFAKDYHYDLRLMISAPPFFPTTGDYVVLSWREQK